MRKWIDNSPATDTMYVCKGGTIDDELNIIERVKGQLIVPKYFYMASYIKTVRDIRHSHFGLSMRMLTAARMTSRNMSFPSTSWKW